MEFGVRKSVREAGGRNAEVVELFDRKESVRTEIWPQWGFNCLRWQVREPGGGFADLFHVAADWEANPAPTRSGHPILFPFPGRLRDGAFLFDGRCFNLPLNDSTGRHAIHGFSPRTRWRVKEAKAAGDHAFVTGELSLSEDLPETLPYWPTDFCLVVTYTLFIDRLRVDARVENRGPRLLPFGLGYHPYFRLAGTSEPDINRYVLKAGVDKEWESMDLLPTGVRAPLTLSLDFREPRPIGSIELDHVMTRIRSNTELPGQLIEIVELSSPELANRLRILVDPAFRELVLFTPAHRRSIAIEPYTCSADAANLAARGIDSGWRLLSSHAEWSAAVEYHWMTGR